MTGDTVRSTGGAVQRRNRAASLAAPAVHDVYRRSISESPECYTPRPRPPHQGRSHSVKIRKTRTAPELDALSRWYCYRVRSFHLSSRGLVNRGDSVRYRQRRQPATSPTTPSTPRDFPTSPTFPITSTTASTPAINTIPQEPPQQIQLQDPDAEKYRVQLVGSSGVGKTALSNQFLTSEHIFVRSSLPEVSCGEGSVTILLNGVEAQLTFVDGTTKVAQGEETGEPDGYLVVYSVASRESFDLARKMLHEMRPRLMNKAVILVGNKSDLVRARSITPQEGREMASTYRTKFIETSVGINHNVDELLVGTVTQMRLKQRHRRGKNWPSLQRASFRLRKILHRLMGRDEPTPPCDALHKL